MMSSLINDDVSDDGDNNWDNITTTLTAAKK